MARAAKQKQLPTRRWRKPKLEADERAAEEELKREAARALKDEQERRRKLRRALVDMLQRKMVCRHYKHINRNKLRAPW